MFPTMDAWYMVCNYFPAGKQCSTIISTYRTSADLNIHRQHGWPVCRQRQGSHWQPRRRCLSVSPSSTPGLTQTFFGVHHFLAGTNRLGRHASCPNYLSSDAVTLSRVSQTIAGSFRYSDRIYQKEIPSTAIRFVARPLKMVTFMLYFHSRPRNQAIRGLDYARPSWRSLAPDYLCQNTMFVLYLFISIRTSRPMGNAARSFLKLLLFCYNFCTRWSSHAGTHPFCPRHPAVSPKYLAMPTMNHDKTNSAASLYFHLCDSCDNWAM